MDSPPVSEEHDATPAQPPAPARRWWPAFKIGMPHLGVGVLALVLAVLIILSIRRSLDPPIVAFEAETSVVTIEPASDGFVWNLPAKDVRRLTGDPDTPVEELMSPKPGIGALVVPPGALISVTRVKDRPLYIRVVRDGPAAPDGSSGKAVQGEWPRLISSVAQYHEGVYADGIRLMPGTTIIVPAGRNDEAPDAAQSNPLAGKGACGHSLPQISVRGSGYITVGALMLEDSYDPPEVLAQAAHLSEEDHFTQPLLRSGNIQKYGPSTVLGGAYLAGEETLRLGDYITIDRPRSAPAGSGDPKTNPQVTTFILDISGCDPMHVRGRVSSRNLLFNRVGPFGSPPDFLRIPWWMHFTKDPVLSGGAALAVALAGLLEMFSKARDLWGTARRKKKEGAE